MHGKISRQGLTKCENATDEAKGETQSSVSYIRWYPIPANLNQVAGIESILYLFHPHIYPNKHSTRQDVFIIIRRMLIKVADA